ncbi:tetratricopeptide repeat protein [Leptolyngbya sp. FACHB-711]|uniref:tetratricopeptide repeat protein n=1 Tax=unclassified Leptolyngbya TaxID=2650499 RepID=UPI0016823315|nr:tetratricopeptide repeat protein [Leptolyngbya sp. FACHB-711]MBD1850460.1 tetratricopeptide repeat protein [Cyanobacteria bacterium FACHB-502]MBD2026038.1 tetratricopeptide repeat protein [Leptolyngbya sp. FACHB-711]
MTANSIDWDEDLPSTPAEEYQALVRALRRIEGFGIIFVRCNDADEESLIRQVKADLPHKTIDQLQLTADSTNFYEAVESLPNYKQTNILFVRGLKHSLYAYEQTKQILRWRADETHSYSWKGVPKILANLNQQRDRFRDDFKICFVFLLPLFAIKYLIHRAPDFYDWRSGIFEFPMEKDTLDREVYRVWLEGDYNDYLIWTDAQRYRKLAEIQNLLEEPQLPLDGKVNLLSELAVLSQAAGEHKSVLHTWDEVLRLKPDLGVAWSNRGLALAKLGRYEEAIGSWGKAIEFKPDSYEAWYNRGIALVNLERYEEAIDSWNKALKLKPDYHKAWNNKACCYSLWNQVDKAIESLQQAIELNPKYREMAKTDSDFDNIRSDDRFKALIEDSDSE